MPARFTAADERLDGVRGCVAVERGPVVYCLEQVDLPECAIDGVAVDPAQPIVRGSAAGLDAETLALTAAGWRLRSGDHEWPYGPLHAHGSDPLEPVRLTLVPYYLWSNRSDDAMRVWIPRF